MRTTLAYFGQDCTDSAVIRRIASFREAGVQVVGLTFRRLKFNRTYRPDWDNIDLGTTRDRDYLRRAWMLVAALARCVAAGQRLRRADLIMARNIDMALLAIAARTLTGASTPLVYEVLDVNRVFTAPGLKGRIARAVERWVLARSCLLVVSSPVFMSAYFHPVLGYRGDWFLLENKICAAQMPAETTTGTAAPADRPEPGAPWVIGWFGTMRCVRSLHLLAAIADALGDRVRIDLRGFPTETGLEPFLDLIATRPNMVYGGEYKSPQDLHRLYGGVHLAWCFDYHDAGANSRWLLPNRLYDAGYHGVPSLGAEGTHTGDRLTADGLGWTFPEPLVPAIVAFLERLSPAEWQVQRDHILSLPPDRFVDHGDIPAMLSTLQAAGAVPVPKQGQAPVTVEITPPGGAGSGRSASRPPPART
jgi:succinoglycan biosynthesis protein ExoL